MSMTRVVIDALRAHTLMPAGWFRGARCFCGWKVNSPKLEGRSRLDQHRAHAALHVIRALASEQQCDRLRCHCGEPVTYGYDGDPTHHRDMCADCDAVRCDAYPMDCPMRRKAER